MERTLPEPPARTDQAPGYVHVKFHEGSFQWPTSERVGGYLRRLVDLTECEQLNLDFADVKFLAGIGLGQLVALHRKLKARGANLILRNVPNRIAEVLAVTGLTAVFNIRSVVE